MNKYNLLGENVYFDYKRSIFSFKNIEESFLQSLPLLPSPIEYAKNYKITSYSICLDISNACNLNCSYCFNNSKDGKLIKYKDAIKLLEMFFKEFPDGQKYYIDLSGKGEPLLNVKTILRISDWCKNKQDEIRREILPQFVTNGTLLSPGIVSKLLDNGMLFGVSLDGDKVIHDLYRKDKSGKGTFDLIIDNVSKIENRDYVGCAVSITNNVFPLVKTIDYLKKYFKTISIRPVRGEFSIRGDSVEKWKREYDDLSVKILDEVGGGDTSTLFCLMNGEDYFGRYLNRAIGGFRTPIRCDAGISRFAFDVEGRLYSCPGMSADVSFSKDYSFLHKQDLTVMLKAQICKDCEFKLLCGGECEIVLLQKGKVDDTLCDFRKHLILLSLFISEKIRLNYPDIFNELRKFSYEKLNRNLINPELESYLKSNPTKPFTQAKREFDKLFKKY